MQTFLLSFRIQEKLEIEFNNQFPQIGNLSDCSPGNQHESQSKNYQSYKSCELMTVGYSLSLQKLKQFQYYNFSQGLPFFGLFNEAHQLYQQVGTVQSINECQIYYQSNILDGFEGCPLFAQNDKNQLILIGMHTNSSYNKGIYFTIEIVQTILLIMKKTQEMKREENNNQLLQNKQKNIFSWLQEKSKFRDQFNNENNKRFQELLKQKPKDKPNPVSDNKSQTKINNEIKGRIQKIVKQLDQKLDQELKRENEEPKIFKSNLKENKNGCTDPYLRMRLNKNNLSINHLEKLLTVQKQIQS